MNNLVIFVIVGAFLCGAAVGQKDDFDSCSAAADCKNKCCFNSDYCAPPVNGTCSQQYMKACKNPSSDLQKLLCRLIKALSNLIKQLSESQESGGDGSVVSELLATLGGLLRRLLTALPSLSPLINSIIRLLTGLNTDIDKLLPVLNTLIANLLKALV